VTPVPAAASTTRLAPSSAPSSPPSRQDLSFAESVCLVLVTQKVSHGWALGTALAPDGDVGRIWTLSRPLTYRAVDGLIEKGLLTRRGQTAGKGADRVVLAATAAGRKAAQRWLDAPIRHLRDVRTELLVKLLLRERAGLDNGPFLVEQQACLEPLIAALSSSAPEDDLVDLWRRESAHTVRRFLEEAARSAAGPSDAVPPIRLRQKGHVMKLSARNQLDATVDTVTHGEVMSTVRVTLQGGQHITAAITKDAAQELGLAPGDAVTVVIKSTEVMLAKD
jgi:molybdopterin-binding protein